MADTSTHRGWLPLDKCLTERGMRQLAVLFPGHGWAREWGVLATDVPLADLGETAEVVTLPTAAPAPTAAADLRQESVA